MRENLSVLHISAADNWGGSGRAAYRIHTGLKRLGVRSRLLVGMKITTDPDVDHIAGLCARLLDRACGGALDLIGAQYLFYPSSFMVSRRRWFREADVVQLYNTHGGYFSHAALPNISRRRPVVWRLSDMWSFTGHCSYSYDCDRWKLGCGSCPIVSDPPALRLDTTAYLWRVKASLYRRSNLTIVAPSRWIARLARESPLLSRFAIHVIPNGIDTDVFRPVGKAAAREVLGLDPSAHVIMFSAHFLSDRRKGGDILPEVLARVRHGLPPSADLRVLAVGAGAADWDAGSGIVVKRLENVSNDETMAAAYSAADVFVLPTLAENLPNGVIESLACGTPAVAFDVGGCAEAVRHLETGFLARYRDTDNLAHGILTLLTDSTLRTRLGMTARAVAEREYGVVLQARRHIELYQSLRRPSLGAGVEQ